MDDKEFLTQRIRDLEASVAYFSPSNKKESERWVANAFVENLLIPYRRDEIASSEQDPPDITFRDASFEIKEILDPGRRRHDEYKQELARARTLTDPADLLQMFTPKESSLEEIYVLCAQVALGLGNKYPEAVRAKLDLLLYVNLIDVMYVAETAYPDTSSLERSGWRSVSFVMGQRSGCFYARQDAPAFLQQILGRISHFHQR